MSFKESMSSFGRYLKELVNLSEHIDVVAASANIRSNVQFRGPNVFILFFAILIASLGLNVNSIPVIIGAMLISPLMGPIMGFGLGLGTNDTDLVGESLKNLLVMVAISILASTLYFVLTPLDLEHPTELLARTNPTIYDVLIALFGGLAGIVETTRKDKGTVMSGVAIATALMPPLCTVGYGIAQLNWHYALGALYLFCINSIFISLATFVMVKYFHYPNIQLTDKKKEKKRKWAVLLIMIAILIPGFVSTIDIVRDNNVRIAASHFVNGCKSVGKSYIYDYKIDDSGKMVMLNLYMAGERLSDANRETIYQEAEKQGFFRNQIVFHEEAVTQGFDQEALVKDIFEYHNRQLEEKDRLIDSLRNELRLMGDELENLRESERKRLEEASHPQDSVSQTM